MRLSSICVPDYIISCKQFDGLKSRRGKSSDENTNGYNTHLQSSAPNEQH